MLDCAHFDPVERELFVLAHRVVECITYGDASSYAELCTPDLSCFEEVTPHRIDGVEFHVSLIRQVSESAKPPKRFDLLSPRVQVYGDCGIVTYTRLTTFDEPVPRWTAFNETRVFVKTAAGWKMAHFHRSPA